MNKFVKVSIDKPKNADIPQKHFKFIIYLQKFFTSVEMFISFVQVFLEIQNWVFLSVLRSASWSKISYEY